MTQTFPVEADPPVAVPVGPPPEFQVDLGVFEGPLPLLLQLIESAELDILTVPLATVADAYVAYLATHPVDAVNLAQFVATAPRSSSSSRAACCLPSRPTPWRPVPRTWTRRSCAAAWWPTAPSATRPASSPRATWSRRCGGASPGCRPARGTAPAARSGHPGHGPRPAGVGRRARAGAARDRAPGRDRHPADRRPARRARSGGQGRAAGHPGRRIEPDRAGGDPDGGPRARPTARAPGEADITVRADRARTSPEARA